jgi:hypothetical protein
MEHIVLVAFCVSADSPKDAQEYLFDRLPIDRPLEDVGIESWWVAEDARYDGSDLDSAVFCHPGKQITSRDLLRAAGLA